MSEEKEKNGEKQKSLREKYGISDSLRRLMYDTNSHIDKAEKKNEEYNLDRSIENIVSGNTDDVYSKTKDKEIGKKAITKLGDEIIQVENDNEKVKKYVWDNNHEDREKAKEETKNFFEEKERTRGKDIYTRNLKISEDQKAALDAFFSNSEEDIVEDKKSRKKKSKKEKKNEKSIPYIPKDYGRDEEDLDTDIDRNDNTYKEESNLDRDRGLDIDDEEARREEMQDSYMEDTSFDKENKGLFEGSNTRIDSKTNIIELAKLAEEERKQELENGKFSEIESNESEIAETNSKLSGLGFQIDEERLNNISTNIYEEDMEIEENNSKFIGLIILEVIIILLLLGYGYMMVKRPDLLKHFSFINPVENVKDLKSVYTLEIEKINVKTGVRKNEGNNIEKHPVILNSGEVEDNIIIAAHNKEGLFKDISKLKNGDKIKLKKDNVENTYSVIKQKTAKPTEIEELKKLKKDQLILITCTDDDSERLIVIAEKTKIAVDNTKAEEK